MGSVQTRFHLRYVWVKFCKISLYLARFLVRPLPPFERENEKENDRESKQLHGIELTVI